MLLHTTSLVSISYLDERWTFLSGLRVASPKKAQLADVRGAQRRGLMRNAPDIAPLGSKTAPESNWTRQKRTKTALLSQLTDDHDPVVPTLSCQ